MSLRCGIRCRTAKDPAPSLDEISVADWWLLINSRSYLFPRRERLDRLVSSYLANGHTQEVITFDTRRLLHAVETNVEVATVNAGVFPRSKEPSRGRKTFQPLASFDGRIPTINEVTVTAALPIDDAAVVDAKRYTPGHEPAPIEDPQPRQ